MTFRSDDMRSAVSHPSQVLRLTQQCVVVVHVVKLIVVFVATAIFSFHRVILDKAISATCTLIMPAAR